MSNTMILVGKHVPTKFKKKKLEETKTKLKITFH